MPPTLPRALLLALVGCLGLCLHTAAAQPAIDGFTTLDVHGFPVLVNDEDAAAHPAQMDVALGELTHQLGAIVALALRPSVMEALRDVKIFLVWNVRPDGAAWYHPSQQWLIDNGRNPEKARSVEIANALNFVNWSRQNQPWMVLHELSHAFHHQVLGYEHAATRAAFENARDAGTYDSVPYNPGPRQARFNQRAYALNNEMEYLAELTEAFFGENDFYPFTRADLSTHDPEGYALMVDVWQVSTTTATDAHPEAAALAVYPNPVRDVLHVAAPEATVVRVFDTAGRVVATVYPGAGGASVDLGRLPSGVYLVRAESDAGVETRRVVRVR